MESILLLIGTGLAAAAPPAILEGRADSPVRVVIYEDLQCSDCAVFRRMLDEKLLPRFGSKVLFEHRDFPLAKHAWARRAAIAGRHFLSVSPELCAAWRRETMASQRAIKAGGFEAWLREFAVKHKQDPGKALASLSDQSLAAAVDADLQEGVARGVARTPTALVNGQPFIETFTFDEISQGIVKALKENGIQ